MFELKFHIRIDLSDDPLFFVVVCVYSYKNIYNYFMVIIFGKAKLNIKISSIKQLSINNRFVNHDIFFESYSAKFSE